MGTADPEIKIGRKFDQVLEGARTVFLKEGYQAASVDMISREAGVSKATLYSYFPDKKVLFLEVARRECARFADAMELSVAENPDIRFVLTHISRGLIRFLISDFGLSMFRVAVAEADRFPEIARAFFQAGPGDGQDRMAEYLEGCVAQGLLQISDCKLAAQQFGELCKVHCVQQMLFKVIDSVPDAEIDRIAIATVDMFLARYGVPEDTNPSPKTASYT